MSEDRHAELAAAHARMIRPALLENEVAQLTERVAMLRYALVVAEPYVPRTPRTITIEIVERALADTADAEKWLVERLADSAQEAVLKFEADVLPGLLAEERERCACVIDGADAEWHEIEDATGVEMLAACAKVIRALSPSTAGDGGTK